MGAGWEVWWGWGATRRVGDRETSDHPPATKYARCQPRVWRRWRCMRIRQHVHQSSFGIDVVHPPPVHLNTGSTSRGSCLPSTKANSEEHG